MALYRPRYQAVVSRTSSRILVNKIHYAGGFKLIYLLTAVTHRRQSDFKDWRIGRLVVSHFPGLAWVVMPDHFHWLVELHSGDLPKLMQTTKSRNARAINQARGESATVWRKGYFDRALRPEEDLKAMARYLVANPLRAG